MYVLTGMMAIGLCIRYDLVLSRWISANVGCSLAQGVEVSLILKILLISTSEGYFFLCIGDIYVFLGPLRSMVLNPPSTDPSTERFSTSPDDRYQPPWYRGWPWSRGWHLLFHAFLQFLIFLLALGFFIKSYKDDGNLVLLALVSFESVLNCTTTNTKQILFTISSICNLRTLLRQLLRPENVLFNPRSLKLLLSPFLGYLRY